MEKKKRKKKTPRNHFILTNPRSSKNFSPNSIWPSTPNSSQTQSLSLSLSLSHISRHRQVGSSRHRQVGSITRSLHTFSPIWPKTKMDLLFWHTQFQFQFHFPPTSHNSQTNKQTNKHVMSSKLHCLQHNPLRMSTRPSPELLHKQMHSLPSHLRHPNRHGCRLLHRIPSDHLRLRLHQKVHSVTGCLLGSHVGDATVLACLLLLFAFQESWWWQKCLVQDQVVD